MLINIIKQNIENIKEKINIYKSDYKKALENFKNNNIKFDLIFLDPPYEMNLINDSLDKIYKYKLLNDNGIIVCEFENEKVENDNYELIKQKKYGSKNIYIYKLKV